MLFKHVLGPRRDMCDATITLTPVQIVTIHGWSNPRRLLSWKDVYTNQRITTKLCSSCGVDDEMLYQIQPNLQMWMDVKGVSFRDVPYMTRWPLHPFSDLGGYIPDLIENRYDATLLHKLGIDYPTLLERNMTVSWMKMFNFGGKDWALLGFRVEHSLM
jgi:hypothetical protein